MEKPRGEGWACRLPGVSGGNTVSRKVAYDFYLLNCLHYEWARINTDMVACQICGELKPVIIALARKWA